MNFFEGIYRPDEYMRFQETDVLGNDPMQQLALNLFSRRKIIFYKQTCGYDTDPRGYVDVYGEDPAQKITFDKDHNIKFQMLAVFFDHISVQLPSLCSMTITPESDGLHISVFTQSSRGFEYELYDTTVIPIDSFRSYLVSIAEEIRSRRPS